MIEFRNIFEVSRDEYKSFVNELKPEIRKVEVEQINKTHTAAKIYSKKTGKCLCSRVAYSVDYGEPDPEKYYIFEIPDDDERLPPIPVQRIVLTSKEEVQAFFDAVAKLQKKEKEKND